MAETIKPAPPATPEQNLAAEQYWESLDSLRGKYNFVSSAALAGNEMALVKLLNDPKIPEDRKMALVAQINGLQQNLPDNSWLDQWSESFIGTSNYRKSMNEISGNIGKLIGDVINANYEEDYNDSISKVSRERAAGLNPDLAGVSGDAAGSATDANEMATPYTAPASMDGSAVLGNFTDIGVKGVQLITGFVGQVQGWVQSDIANSLSEVALDDALRDNIRKSFSTLANDPDALDAGMIDALKARYSDYDTDDNIFEGTKLSSIVTREDLDKWINGYNKKYPESPVDILSLRGSAILNAAKQYPNPYTSLRTRRAYDRAIRSISPTSPFVRSYIDELESKSVSAQRSAIEDKIQIKALLGDYGKAYQSGLTILQEAQNEINAYNKKYYSAKNGSVQIQSGQDDAGNTLFSEEDVVNLEVSAEAEEADAAKRNAIASKYRAKIAAAMRETLESRLEEIKRTSGPDSWHYIIASIIYPSMMSYLENGIAQQIGSMLSRPKPAPVNNQTTKNTYIDSHDYTDIQSYH